MEKVLKIMIYTQYTNQRILKKIKLVIVIITGSKNISFIFFSKIQNFQALNNFLVFYPIYNRKIFFYINKYGIFKFFS